MITTENQQKSNKVVNIILNIIIVILSIAVVVMAVVKFVPKSVFQIFEKKDSTTESTVFTPPEDPEDYDGDYTVDIKNMDFFSMISKKIDDLPEEIVSWTEEYITERVYHVADMGANAPSRYKVNNATCTVLEKVETGTVSEYVSINMYRLEYRMLLNRARTVVIGEGMSDDSGWLTFSTEYNPIYLVAYNRLDTGDDSLKRLAVISEAELEAQYGTEEMIEEYGNPYTAACTELYNASQK